MESTALRAVVEPRWAPVDEWTPGLELQTLRGVAYGEAEELAACAAGVACDAAVGAGAGDAGVGAITTVTTQPAKLGSFWLVSWKNWTRPALPADVTKLAAWRIRTAMDMQVSNASSAVFF